MTDNEKAIQKRFGSAAVILLRINRKDRATPEIAHAYRQTWKNIVEYAPRVSSYDSIEEWFKEIEKDE